VKSKERKSYYCNRFGHRFQIVLNGTTTTAIVRDITYYQKGDFVGIAVLHDPDEYDRELGVRLAMKAALSKMHSAVVSEYTRDIGGYQSRMRLFNAALANEIECRRGINKTS